MVRTSVQLLETDLRVVATVYRLGPEVHAAI
jgi:hypothetical protein